MHFYYFMAIENYKDMFQFMRATEIKCFNNYLYFYYINNRINLLTIAVDLNKIPFIVAEG